MKNKNLNGYIVCYREQGSRQYIRYFITYTLRHAKLVKNSYQLYPPRDRNDNHKLLNPVKLRRYV